MTPVLYVTVMLIDCVHGALACCSQPFVLLGV